MKTKSLLTSLLRQAQDGEPVEPFTKGRNYPSLAKRGEGRFSEIHVYFIKGSLATLSFSPSLLQGWEEE